MASTTTAPVYRSATRVAYDYLREKILSRELAGGDRVNLDHVAGTLGISRMPVRDAVRQLSADGLLTIYPRRGVVVTSLSVGDVLELFETRAVLESLAVARGMSAIGTAELATLGGIVDQLEGWRGDAADYLRMHDEFHETLCGYAGRPRLLANIRSIREAVEPYIRLFLTLHGSEMGGTLHRPIIDAIASRDVQRAEAAVHAHVVAGGTGLAGFLKTNGVVRDG